MTKNLFAILCLFLFISCAGRKETTVEVENISPETLYERGEKYLDAGEYKQALQSFSRVSNEFPYHKLSSKAEMMEAYTNYKMGEYDFAVAIADHYVKLHPANKDVPYILYLKALSYYNQIDIPYRDQENTYKAKKAFLQLIKRFPKSEYARDSKVKLDLVEDHLAAHEMVVGRFYQTKGSMLSAINRFQNVVKRYSRTTQIQEALYRLVETYSFLGLQKEAEMNAAVLGHNYPGSKWYKRSYDLLKK